MGKKKGKDKKLSVKAEKYAKFHKEKPAVLNISMPELTPDQQKQAQDADRNITYFLRHNRNPPTKEVSERRMKSKR